MRLADLDGDARLDIAGGLSYLDTVAVFFNRGSGSFDPQRQFAGGLRPFGAAAGDLDRDGDVDLLLTALDSNTLSILLNRSIDCGGASADGTRTGAHR